MNFQDWFLLELTGLISLQSKGLSGAFSTPQFKSINSSVLSFLYGPTLTSICDYWKQHSFDLSVMSLLFNMLSRLVIAFLPRSKHLLISLLQSPSAVILKPKKIKSVTVFFVSPSICHEVMGPDAMIFVYWMLSFNPAFSTLLFFTFIKRLFSSSLLSAIKVVPSAHPRLLIFLPAILIPACALFSPAFHMMYSAYKLNKQGDNIQPWYTPFLIWNQSVFPCLVLSVASWPAYRFLKRQIRWSGIPISWKIFQLWSTQCLLTSAIYLSTYLSIYLFCNQLPVVRIIFRINNADKFQKSLDLCTTS